MRIETMQIWALLAITCIGIYVLPNVVATFAGSHSMEYNETEGLHELRCTKCHSYISDELGATDLALDVMAAHRAAAENSNYIGLDGEINISRSGLPLIGGAMVNVCMLCHLAEQGTLSITGSHTKMIIRVCTDTDCHGNSTNTGTGLYNVAGGVGGNLSNTADAHSGWFDAMDTEASSYTNEDGGYYNSGFYACMACHTHAEMNMNISRPKAFDINITLGASGVTITGPTINYTSPNVTTAQRTYGSVWS